MRCDRFLPKGGIGGHDPVDRGVRRLSPTFVQAVLFCTLDNFEIGGSFEAVPGIHIRGRVAIHSGGRSRYFPGWRTSRRARIGFRCRALCVRRRQRAKHCKRNGDDLSELH